MRTKKIAYAALAFALVVAVVFVFVVGKNKEQKYSEPQGVSMNQTHTKKIVFIHHSVGGHWLAHDTGGLVSELNTKGFYVNDITYGWQPGWVENSALKRARNKLFELFNYNPGGAYKIGDHTDIGHYYEWFLGADSERIMEAVYDEDLETTTFGDHPNTIENPGENLENEVVMIKSCYPNTLYRGDGDDKPTEGESPPRNFPAGSDEHTVANCKRIYNDLINYFKKRPDKFFVMVTAPPRMELPNNGKTARAFSNWLVHDWLKANNYNCNNVMVFDLYNVLTSGKSWHENDVGYTTGNHHRFMNNQEQHIVQIENHELYYPRNGEDNHPSKAGLEKATQEFSDLFLYRYNKWIESSLFK